MADEGLGIIRVAERRMGGRSFGIRRSNRLHRYVDTRGFCLWRS